MMDMDNDTAVPPESNGEPQGQGARARWRRETFIPTIAVVAVAVCAVVTAVMVTRSRSPEAQSQRAEDASISRQSVVTAPPLNLSPPAAAEAPAQVGSTPAAPNAMGATAACRNCGVVQMVIAVHEYGKPDPASYQMHIRMDDGSTLTVEQRGALAAGSRVVVEGKSVRPWPQAGGG